MICGGYKRRGSYSHNEQSAEKNVQGCGRWGKRNHTRGDKAHVDFKTYT
jgi:hypothetical protein